MKVIVTTMKTNERNAVTRTVNKNDNGKMIVKVFVMKMKTNERTVVTRTVNKADNGMMIVKFFVMRREKVAEIGKGTVIKKGGEKRK